MFIEEILRYKKIWNISWEWANCAARGNGKRQQKSEENRVNEKQSWKWDMFITKIISGDVASTFFFVVQYYVQIVPHLYI